MCADRRNLAGELEALRRKARGAFGIKPKWDTSDVQKGAGVDGRDFDSLHLRTGPLEELIPGREITTGDGSFYRVLEPASSIWEDAGSLPRQYTDLISGSMIEQGAGMDKLRILEESTAGEICFLDLETTGLNMTPLFLAGLMYLSDEQLILDQLFARDYTEERAILCFLKEMLDSYSLLVTYNGNGFDIPFLRQRMHYHGMKLGNNCRHLDLLPVARKVLKGRTPNHKLQTLEVYLLGRKRAGDIPGCRIPGVYHDFVRSGDAGEIERVIHHNRLDLVTMIKLIMVFMRERF